MEKFLVKKPLLALLISAVAIVAIVSFVYYFLLSSNPKYYRAPDLLDEYIFEETLLPSIEKKEDREFVKSIYKKTDSDYILKTETPDRQKLINILIESGYYYDLQTIDRSMETVPKEILNGKLGIFFRFELLGNLNWLALIVLVSTIRKWRKLERKDLFFISVYIGAFLLISLPALPNYRYQMTLLPFTLMIVFHGVWELISVNKFKRYKNWIYAFLLLLIAANNLIYFSKLSEFISSDSSETLSTEQSLKEVEKLVELSGEDKVLVNNLPEFYYYTDLKGAYYSSASDFLFINEREKLFYGRSIDEVNEFLKDELNVRYIISNELMDEYSAPYREFLKVYTEEVYKDENFVLYKLK